MFLYVDSDLENLTKTAFIDVMVFDQDGGLIELQYRVDGKGPWMVAERSDMAYIYEYFWYYKYDTYIYETDGALWTIEIDAENLTEGNHALQMRVLHHERYDYYDYLCYTPVYLSNFTTLKDTVGSESSKAANNALPAFLVSSLVILSIVSVAVVSNKTKFAK